MRLTPPRLLLFDLDDTLCDYAHARALRLRLAFAPALETRPDSDLALDRLVADSLATHPHGADHFPELFARHDIMDPTVAETAMTWYRTNRFHALELFTDTIGTLERLRRDLPGRRIGLVTNGPTDVQQEKIALLGLEPLIDFAVVSETFGASKPDPAIFAEALRLGQATPDEAVFIGDSPEYDMAGARAAGIHSIWMNRGGHPWPEDAPPPDDVVHSLTELRTLLNRGF